MPAHPPIHRPARWVMLLLGVLLAACGTSGPTGSFAPTTVPASAAPSGPASIAPSPATPPASPSHATLRPVRLALDWTPNTNHLGFFVADAKGWYADSGVQLQVLPYATSTPEALLTAHQAECGISFQDSLTFAVAAGAPIVSVMAILQHTGQELAVLASSGIQRPRDLDHKIYAGFGYPNEEPTIRAVITADGGTGEFTSVILDTAAYEALYAKRADFAIIFVAQEGVEAKLRDIQLRTFKFTDHGFPDFYQVVLACDRDWLGREPKLARSFVEATVRGWEFAAAEPDAAADLLIAENPGVFEANPALPHESARFLADGGYLVDAAGQVGSQTLATWQGYSGFLFQQGLLAGPDGKPLATAPDYASLFTTAFLPSAG